MSWRLARALEAVQPVQAASALTLFLALVPGRTDLHWVSVALAVAGLVVPLVRARAELWLALFLVRTADHLMGGWYLVDNHHYLLTYWCLALGLSLASFDPARTLRTNARLLLGLCFALAGLWKILGGEYANGAFPGYLLLTDPGFSSFLPRTNIVGDVIQSNVSTLGAQNAPLGSTDVVVLQGAGSGIRGLGVAIGLWTIWIELLVGAAFLLPLRGRWVYLGDLALVGFVTTTYFLAPVLTFGLLLLLMGFTRLELHEHGWRAAYAGAFVALPPAIYTVIGLPSVGLRLTGAMLVYGYLCRWGRGPLILGLLALGASVAMDYRPSTPTFANGVMGAGFGVVVLALLDALFRRRTERAVLVPGAVLLLAALGLIRPLDAGLVGAIFAGLAVLTLSFSYRGRAES